MGMIAPRGVLQSVHLFWLSLCVVTQIHQVDFPMKYRSKMLKGMETDCFPSMRRIQERRCSELCANGNP